MSDQHFSTLGMLLDQLMDLSGLYVFGLSIKEDHVAFDGIPVGSGLPVKSGSALAFDCASWFPVWPLRPFIM
jgi:hypothetical protein